MMMKDGSAAWDAVRSLHASGAALPRAESTTALARIFEGSGRLNVVVMELRLDPAVPTANFPRITLAPGQSKTIGRSAPADVIVDHPSISRRHARISMDTSGQLAVDDLGSTNGVFVNGTEQRSAYLMVGDVVRFGQVEYVLAEAT